MGSASPPLRRWLLTPLLFAAALFVVWGGPTLLDLGFYHDDWPLLLRLETSTLALPARLLAEYGNGVHLYRPLTPLAWTLPHAAFGLDPLPWQLLAMLFNLLLAHAVYRLLRRYHLEPAAALLAALAFLAYPNKDATLYWPDVAIILTFSLWMFVEGWLRHLAWAAHGRRRDRVLAALAVVLGLAAYEQCVFLLPLWVLTPAGLGKRRVAAGLKSAGAAWLAFLLYKYGLLPLLYPQPKSIELSPLRVGYTAFTALRAHFDPRYWLYLGGCFFDALRAAPGLVVLALALPWCAVRGANRVGRADAAWRLVVLGAGVFVLGYLPLAVSTYVPTPYNMMNRLNQVPALGVVMLAAGAWCRRGEGWRPRAAAALLCGLFLAVHVAFAGYWAQSYRRQLEVRDAVLVYSDRWPADKTLVVRLHARYVKDRAPVFDAYYDMASALTLWSGRRRPADVWSPRMRVEPEGLRTDNGRKAYDDLILFDLPAREWGPGTRRRFLSLPSAAAVWER